MNVAKDPVCGMTVLQDVSLTGRLSRLLLLRFLQSNVRASAREIRQSPCGDRARRHRPELGRVFLHGDRAR